MKDSDFNKWQEHLARELRKNYIKLSYVKPTKKSLQVLKVIKNSLYL